MWKMPSGQGDQCLLESHDVSAELTLAELGTVCASPAFGALTPRVGHSDSWLSRETHNSRYQLEINERWAGGRSYTNLATTLSAWHFLGSGVGQNNLHLAS